MFSLHLENTTFCKGRENSTAKNGLSFGTTTGKRKDFEENHKSVCVSCYHSCPYYTLSKKEHREGTQKGFPGMLLSESSISEGWIHKSLSNTSLGRKKKTNLKQNKISQDSCACRSLRFWLCFKQTRKATESV